MYEWVELEWIHPQVVYLMLAAHATLQWASTVGPGQGTASQR